MYRFDRKLRLILLFPDDWVQDDLTFEILMIFQVYSRLCLLKRPQVVSKLIFFVKSGVFKRKNLYLDVPLIVIFCMSVYAKDSPNLTVGTACKKMKKLAP